jgi:hypothetical protein
MKGTELLGSFILGHPDYSRLLKYQGEIQIPEVRPEVKFSILKLALLYHTIHLDA